MAINDVYPRLLLEGVVIVCSILLAFAIQAWWDERQEAEEALRLLISIRSENRENIREIEDYFEPYQQAVIGYVGELAQLAVDPENADPDQVDRLILDMLWYQNDRMNWSALNALVDGGLLTLVDDPELRDELAGLRIYPTLYNTLYELERQHVNERIMPYLSKNGLLPQLQNASGDFPGSTDRPYPVKQFQLAEKIDHRPLLREPEFLSHISWKMTMMSDAEQENSRFLPNARRVDALLTAYLEENQ